MGDQESKKIWAYSMYQFLFNVMSYFIRNLDKMLIGKYIGMAPLGYYEKSYRLMSLPIQNITYVITPVLHPILSDYQKETDKLATINERMVRLLAFIGFPLGILLFFCGRELMLFVFGSQWEPSIPAFQILSLTVGFQIVMSSSGSFFKARTTRAGFLFAAFSQPLPPAPDFWYASCFSYAGSFCLQHADFVFSMFHPMLLATLSLSIPPQHAAFVQTAHLSLIITLLIGGVLYPLSLCSSDWNIVVSLCVKSLLALILWGGYLQWRKEYDIVAKVRNILHKY